MKKLICLAIALMTALCLMIPAFASAAGHTELNETMWVNCSNGGALIVRSEPVKSRSTVMYTIECGTKVTVDTQVPAPEGWAFVNVSGHSAGGYVRVEYLVAKKPGKYEITERSADFRAVNPYMVTAAALKGRPERSVGLRVSPNKTAKMIRRLSAGDKLQVVAVGKTWSKVIDLKTGRIGYAANDYLTRN